jgi:hypothetical protein
MDRSRALATNALLVAEAAQLRDAVPWHSASLAELRLAEIAGSVGFAGLHFRPADVALLARGIAPAGRRLDECDAVADYAAAATHVAKLGQIRSRKRLLRIEEIVALHALATRRSAFDRPGQWRSETAAVLPSGAVPPPAWLVPRDLGVFVDRFASAPAALVPLVSWLADACARLVRIHPFATANGRVTRLVLNLLLARLGYPPFVLRPGDRSRFAAALDRAGARDLWPIAHLLGRSVLTSVRELDFARGMEAEPLVAIGAVDPPHERAALYKAAQRGRLRTLRKGTGIFTTKTWLAEYRRSRAPAGRPPTARPAENF